MVQAATNNDEFIQQLQNPVFLHDLRQQMMKFAVLQLSSFHQAEDVVQEALVSALQHLGSFSGRAAFKTWVFAILKNKIVDLIHQLQLDISGADISFCAPLSFNAEIREGDIYMSDMFNLYKYENLLYTMKLTGKEIKDFLEMSYDLWVNQMTSPDDHLLLLNEKDNGFGRFRNPSFNFDSAAGIIYTVDVTKPRGERITIERMADGESFELDRQYKVAVNSYRGNGGGDLLTKGAGIPKAELAKRIVFSTDKDLRYYLMKRIEEVKVLNPAPLNQWKFIPEEWTVPAAKRDYELLFGNKDNE